MVDMEQIGATSFIKRLKEQPVVSEIIITEDVTLKKLEFSHPIYIHSCRFESNFVIDECHFQDYVMLVDIEVAGSFTIEPKSYFMSDFSIIKSSLKSIQITWPPIQSEVLFNKDASFEHVTSETFRLSGVKIGSSLTIWGSRFTDFCTVDVISADRVSIFSNHYENYGSFTFNQVNRVTSVSANIKDSGEMRLTVSKTHSLDVGRSIRCDFAITNSCINQLLCRGSIFQGVAVKLENLEVHQFGWTHSENRGNLSFYNIQAKEFEELETNGENCTPIKKKPEHSRVFFNRINFGQATFIDFDFNSFEKHDFHSCIIGKIAVKGKHFPPKLNATNFFPQHRNNHNYYEFYHQLYQVMKRQGNRVNEQLYYASALEFYRKELKGFSQTGALLILYLNKLSTNYGLSWLRGAIGTLVVGAIFYCGYVLSFSEISLSFSNPDWTFTWSLVGDYFVFLYPAHRFDFMKPFELNTFSKLLDFLGRIFIGYWIYQTVTASRRLGQR